MGFTMRKPVLPFENMFFHDEPQTNNMEFYDKNTNLWLFIRTLNPLGEHDTG